MCLLIHIYINSIGLLYFEIKCHQIRVFLCQLGISGNADKSSFECYWCKLDENKSFMTYQLQNLTIPTFKSNRKHLEEFSFQDCITNDNKFTQVQKNLSIKLSGSAFL